MYKKYNTSQEPTKLRQDSARVITNDLYLSAFLHSTGCNLSKVEKNDRKRLSFVFCGSRVKELREAYREGPVKLDMRSFRDSLITIRRLMDAEQRSVSHEKRKQFATHP